MKTFSILHQILDALEDYSQSPAATDDLAGFTAYLSKHHPKPQTIPVYKPNAGVEGTIGRLIVAMNRYLKFYVKHALADSPLQTAEEFSYLLLTLQIGPMSKTELIQRNLQEKTTGTEIIRRLIKNGLLEEAVDHTDRRSKKVSATPEGRSVFDHVFARMQKVTRIVSGDLTMEDKTSLKELLIKLEAFHHPIFQNKAVRSGSDLDDIANTIP